MIDVIKKRNLYLSILELVYLKRKKKEEKNLTNEEIKRLIATQTASVDPWTKWWTSKEGGLNGEETRN